MAVKNIATQVAERCARRSRAHEGGLFNRTLGAMWLCARGRPSGGPNQAGNADPIPRKVGCMVAQGVVRALDASLAQVARPTPGCKDRLSPHELPNLCEPHHPHARTDRFHWETPDLSVAELDSLAGRLFQDSPSSPPPTSLLTTEPDAGIRMSRSTAASRLRGRTNLNSKNQPRKRRRLGVCLARSGSGWPPECGVLACSRTRVASGRNATTVRDVSS